MKRILATLILSTAAVGVAQANELGYPPPPQSGGALTHQQVRAELNQIRGQHMSGNGELVGLYQAPELRSNPPVRDQMQRETRMPRRLDLNGNGELDSPIING